MSKQALYSKLMPSGRLDKKNLSQDDYDMVIKYIKESFPKANTMQRDVEQTLKRTFIFGAGSGNTSSKSFRITKSKSLETKRRQKSCVQTVPKRLSHENYMNLNRLWKEYVADLLKDTCMTRTDDIQQKLSRVDFHGADIGVVNANCRSFVGLQGIVVKETKNTFVIVETDGATKIIPKAEGEFRIHIQEPYEGSLLISGNSILTRPAERASKKIKSFMEFTGSRVYKNMLRYTK